jgi:pseudouridine synthase
LDYDTEGLLILTNDGDLTFKLTHPKHEVFKTYIARIEGSLTDAGINSLKNGIALDGEKALPALVRILETDEKFQRVEISIREGKNRQVKRMFEAAGKNVAFLM